MDYSAFSHGQIHSKLWLCENLDIHVKPSSTIVILGSWYNILGFMLQTRKPKYYKEICGIDINKDAIEIANKINQAWMIGNDTVIRNINDNANKLDLRGYDVYINCSVEHMDNNDWFNNIPAGRLVCLQSTNVTIKGDPWYITNPIKSLSVFAKKYKLQQVFFKDKLDFDYGKNSYSRYMLIGIK